MSTILSILSIGKVLVIVTNTNPTLGGGTEAPVGSICMTIDGSGTFTKNGALNTDWGLDTNNYITGEIELDFGTIRGGQGDAKTTIANLILTNSNFKSFSFFPKENTDHNFDDFIAECVSFSISNIQDNVSFDIVASAPNNTWGKYKINYIITK